MPFFQKEGEAENQSGRIINNGKQVDEASAAESEAGKHQIQPTRRKTCSQWIQRI